MSNLAVRYALQARLDAMSPALATAYENTDFTKPAPDVPYQEAYVLPATPDNPESGAGYRELGIFQVTLKYPRGAGTDVAETRAKAIRDWFPKNLSLTDSGVVVNVSKTPGISAGRADGDRWNIPVKVQFHANCFS